MDPAILTAAARRLRDRATFITGTFGISLKEQNTLLEEISDAVSDTAPKVRVAMKQHPKFSDIGKRMLLSWKEGVAGLRDNRVYSVAEWKPGKAFEGYPDPPKLKNPKKIVGRSELLGKR